MSLFVDTSVWSLAFRRDAPPPGREVHALAHAVEFGETIVSTGLVLQEILQGFAGPKQREQILRRFSAVPFVTPDRDDHIQAADLRIVVAGRESRLGQSMPCWLSFASVTA